MQALKIIMLTIDRFELTKKITTQNLARCGVPYELMIIDNGSTDERMQPWIEATAQYYRFNSKNLGVARMFNWGIHTMYDGNSPIFLMGNDILLPDKWGAKMLEAYSNVNDLGLAGFIWTPPVGGVTADFNGYKFHVCPIVYGSWLITPAAIHRVGYLNNAYHPYGLEDTDYFGRVNRSGLITGYIIGESSSHEGSDMGTDSEYRRMKTKSLEDNSHKWKQIQADYLLHGLHLDADSYLKPSEKEEFHYEFKEIRI